MPIIPSETPTPQPTPTPTPLINQIGEWILPITFIILVIGCIILVYKIISIRRNKTSKKNLFADFNVGIYAVKFFRKIGGKYFEISTEKLKIEKGQKLRFNNKDFNHVDLDKIGYCDKRRNYICLDYDTGNQLFFNEKTLPEKIKAEDIDVYVNRGIIQQLVAALEDIKPKGGWLMLICGLALGLGIGIITGIYAAPSINPQATPTPTPQAIISILKEIVK